MAADHNAPKGPSPTAAEELEQFRVRAPLEVHRILRDLARSTELVTAYFNDGREFILTSVLQVDPDQRHLFLDYGPDETLNRRLLERQRAVFVTRHHQVRVQFSTDQIQRIDYEGGPAFVIPLPESLVRVQRREYYRLITPIGQRLNVTFVTADGTTLSAHLADISVGGVGIIEPPEGWVPSCEPGTVIPDCRIELPEEGVIRADIEIRNRYEVGKSAGQPVYHLGCRLLRLDSRSSAAIQRYIHRVDLERRRVRDD